MHIFRTRATPTENNKPVEETARNIVKLDIGGTIFKTSKSTLTKYDGFFKTMLETDVPLVKDSADCIFIDRDAAHFRLILNYMRDGHVELSEYSKREIEEIKKEAEFYLLDGLIKLCKELQGGTTNYKKLRFIESDDEFLQLVTEPVKPVLVLHYSVVMFGKNRYPHGFNVEQFLEKYKDKFDIYFKAQPIGHNSEVEHWQWTIHQYNRYQEGKDPLNWHFPKAIEEDVQKFLRY